MKKRFTLLSVMMIATSLSFAQNVTKPSPVSVSKMKTGKLATTLTTQENTPASEITAKAPGDIIWSTNLTSTNNWVASSLPSSAQSPTNGFRLSSTEIPPFFGTTKINSASGGQYAVFSNGNITSNPPAGVIDAEFMMTLDSTFDLSSYGSVNFEFQQFGALFVEEQVVEATIDGTTWVEIGSNTDMGMLTQASPNNAFANPTNRSYNLNKAFPTGADFSAVKFRFRVYWSGNITGGNRGIAYGWFVDDIKLTEGEANDLNLKQAFAFVGAPENELMYTKFPALQVNASAEMNFSAMVFNEGSAAQNTVLNVTGTNYDENAASVLIAPFTGDSIGVNSVYTIDPTIGNQNLTFSVTSDNALENTGNDTKVFPFEVTPNIMAVDGYNGTTASMTSSFIGWASGTGDAEIGTLFEIFEDAAVGAIQIGIANVPSSGRGEYIGRSVQGKIYDASGSTPVLLDATLETTITSSSFGKLIPAYMITPYPLQAGNVYLVTVSLAQDAEVPIAMGGQVVSGNVLGFNGTSLTGLAPDVEGGNVVTTPIVRLDFNDYTSVNEIAAQFDLNVYPNPFSSNTEVAFELKNDANVSINVTDVTGRTVSTIDSKMYTSGAHTVSVNGTNLTAGVYNCTITIGNNVITKRIVKK